ncbi:hypothetical protein SARC_01985, partial [Sphaeroforma arctica JP610]
AIDHNQEYPNSNNWAFDVESDGIELNLFQPGNKQVYGWCKRDDGHMLYFPTKYASLELYLNALDFETDSRAASVRIKATIVWWLFKSMTVLHRKVSKYIKEGQKPGVCDA